jgi:ribosome-associated protein
MSREQHLTINPAVRIPLSELRFQVSRSSGPGGQNVNKVNTRVQLWWDAAESQALPEDARERLRAQNPNRFTREGSLQIECQEFRTQLANRKACLDELAAIVRRALVRPKRRKATRPTRGSKERRLQSKRERSQQKSSRRFRGGEE